MFDDLLCNYIKNIELIKSWIKENYFIIHSKTFNCRYTRHSVRKCSDILASKPFLLGSFEYRGIKSTDTNGMKKK